MIPAASASSPDRTPDRWLGDVATADAAPPLPWAALDDPLEQARFTRWRVDGQGRRQGCSQLQISGMHCAACSGLIEQALRAVPGVLEAHVSAASERAEVVWDPERVQPSRFLQAIDRAGYGAVPDAAAPARLARQAERRRSLWRLFVAGFCTMQVMMYATPAYVAPPGDITPDVLRLLQWASWLLTVPVVLFSAGPFFSGAWRSLKARRIGMDVPVAIGIAVTFIASSGATFDPGGLFGHEVWFDSVSMFVFFLLGGRHLELAARHQVAAQLESALQRLPEQVERLDDQGRIETVAAARLQPGDRVRVALGQAFAADGRVIGGRTQADEALLTGESRPVPKAVGDGVVAGSLNLGAPVWIEVERVGADTRYEGIVELMRSALTQRPAMVRAADRIAGPFTAAVLLAAAAAAVVWSMIDPGRAVAVAVAVLIVTCPCALGLAAPSALLAAAGRLARRGVLLQRLDAIEALTRIDTVFLDKTGTLTEDRPALVAVAPLTPAMAVEAGGAEGTALCTAEDERTAARRAAALAAHSRHPLSQALVDGVVTLFAAPPGAGPADGGAAAAQAWTEVREVAGCGLAGLDPQGREWRLGSRAWVMDAPAPPAPIARRAGDVREAGSAREAGKAGEAAARRADSASDEPSAQVVFGPVGHARWAFRFDETLRADARAAVAALRAEGLELVILSGDDPQRVHRIAQALGIGQAEGALSPQDKLDAVARAQALGRRVAMVGDGVNDAPVLARADVSVALVHGAGVAKAEADAVLVSGRLIDLVDARRMARRTLRVVRQNFAWAAVYNAACVPLALVGALPPWAAGIGMAASSLLVVLNAQRLLRDEAPTSAP